MPLRIVIFRISASQAQAAVQPGMAASMPAARMAASPSNGMAHRTAMPRMCPTRFFFQAGRLYKGSCPAERAA